MANVNVDLCTPAAPSFILLLHERGEGTATNGRRPQSGCVIEIGF
jgi:hypothetical protein